jgi:type II secretory pathway pseudopilin PulG
MSKGEHGGYTLVEIIVSSFLLLLLLGMLMGPYLVVEHAVTRSDASVQFQQDLRSALDRLTRDMQSGHDPYVVYPYPTGIGQNPEFDYSVAPGGPLSNVVHVFVDPGTTLLVEHVYAPGTLPGATGAIISRNVLGFHVSQVWFRPLWQSNYPVLGQWLDYTSSGSVPPPQGCAAFPFLLPQGALVVVGVSGQPPGALYDTSAANLPPPQVLTTSVCIRS